MIPAYRQLARLVAKRHPRVPDLRTRANLGWPRTI
jgi:hypothetical protein